MGESLAMERRWLSGSYPISTNEVVGEKWLHDSERCVHFNQAERFLKAIYPSIYIKFAHFFWKICVIDSGWLWLGEVFNINSIFRFLISDSQSWAKYKSYAVRSSKRYVYIINSSQNLMTVILKKYMLLKWFL